MNFMMITMVMTKYTLGIVDAYDLSICNSGIQRQNWSTNFFFVQLSSILRNAEWTYFNKKIFIYFMHSTTFHFMPRYLIIMIIIEKKLERAKSWVCFSQKKTLLYAISCNRTGRSYSCAKMVCRCLFHFKVVQTRKIACVHIHDAKLMYALMLYGLK